MTDRTVQLLQMIKEGYTVNEMAERLNLSNRQLYNHITLLRNKGFKFDRKYYYNGDIVYLPITYYNQNAGKEGVDIITETDSEEFRILLISDLHIGCEKQRLDLLDMSYDYCVKNGIHTIFNCGDLINGTFGAKNIHDDVSEQIDYFIKKYPHDKSILNFAVLGNHDVSSLLSLGLDFQEVLLSYRHDIVPLGYGEGIINIKNDKFILRHPIKEVGDKDIQSSDEVIFKGHHHRMGILTLRNSMLVEVPALSDVFMSSNEVFPGALDITFKFSRGYCHSLIIKHLYFDDKVRMINNMYLERGRGRNVDYSKPIELEERRPVKKRIYVPEKRVEMSQIDKFNAKYGIK